MYLPKFEYIETESIDETCNVLGNYQGQARVLAGGTDMLVKMKHRSMIPGYLVNLKKVSGLDYITLDSDKGLLIGPLTTIESIKASDIIRQNYNILQQAAASESNLQIRNIATIGGNIANASPAADVPTALIALDAKIKISGINKTRTINLEKFYTGPGRTTLEDDEIITEVQVPISEKGNSGVYLKKNIRHGGIAIVGLAISANLSGSYCNSINMVLSAVAPTIFKARKAEGMLKGKYITQELLANSAKVACMESSPIDDIRGRAEYRRNLLIGLTKQAFNHILT